MLGAMAAGAGLMGMVDSTNAQAQTNAKTFVLVHGAWHGGWAWQPVASRLRAAGHRVWAPTCPGLGIDDDPRGVTLAGCIEES